MSADDLRLACANSDGSNGILNSVCSMANLPVGSNACLNAGNAVASPLFDKVKDIQLNWSPPDTFDPGQIQGIVTAISGVLNQAMTNVVTTLNAKATTILAPDNATVLQNEIDEINRHLAQGQSYLASADQANSLATSDAPGIVSAPSIKQWVINALNEAAEAQVAAYVVVCNEPWWIGAAAAFETIFDAAVGVVKSIVGAAATLGSAVVTAVEGAATGIKVGSSILGFLFTWWPVLGVLAAGFGGVLVYRRRHKIKGFFKRSSP